MKQVHKHRPRNLLLTPINKNRPRNQIRKHLRRKRFWASVLE